MKRFAIACLLTSAVILPSAVHSSTPAGTHRTDASRRATFVGLRDGETLFVERVRDAPGGFRGEVTLPGGGVWVRYRVELGPNETIRRYELDMSRNGGMQRDLPMPTLVARHEQDSLLIEPRPGTAFPGRRLAVPRSAIMGTLEFAVLEQVIRHGLRMNQVRYEFPLYSAWTGHHRDAIVVRGANGKVRLDSGRDTWEYTLDPQNRIVSALRVNGLEAEPDDPGMDMRVVRIDP